MKLNVGGLIKKVLFMLCLTGLFGGLVEAAAETNAIKAVVYDGLYILGQCNKTTPFYRVGQKAVLTLSALDHRGDKSVDLSNHTLRILRQGEDGKDFEKTIQFVELPWSIDERMKSRALFAFGQICLTSKGNRAVIMKIIAVRIGPFLMAV